AHKQILEHQIVAATTQGARAMQFADSAGIGLYPVDIHGKQDVPGAGQPTRPFQIPLSALLPSRGGNLLPACKNIGTTHVTNGAYRLHPVEWSIGEAQGCLCRIAIDRKITAQQILHDKKLLREFQNYLLQNRIPIYWFADLVPGSEIFRAAQFLAVTQILPADAYTLH